MLKNFMQPSHIKTNRNATSNTLLDTPKPLDPPKSAEISKTESLPTTKPAPRDEGSKLTVGPNIKLKGSEITDCEILVVEGRVEASMNSRDIRIAEGGVFSGKAEIDVAEVRGHFEGELTARKQLIIYATGKVTGHIRYGAIMVEEGGIISGDIATLTSAGKTITEVPELAAVATLTEPDQAENARLEKINSAATLTRNPINRRHG